MARYLTRGMVVLADDHPGTGSALFAAREYTPRTIIVSPAGSAEVPTAQMVHPRGGASIDAAFRCAADDMIPWVAMRRDYAAPESVLSQVLEATGRRAKNDLPGFCVLLTGAEPRRIGRILTVLDRADGEPSGLLILAAVATAQATGADLDVLLLGAPGESMSTPANVHEAVRVSRDKDLYDQAIRRATEAGIRADWIVAEAVDDPQELVLAQVAEGNYDLVIEDLGSVSLGGRLGRGGRIARAVAPDGPAAIVRALLEQTDLPLVIVLDGVRLGLIPPAVVKGGAGTILALGLIASAAPAATASASDLSAQQTTVSQTVDAYDAALGEAADLASPAEVDAALGDADAVLDSQETSTADEAGTETSEEAGDEGDAADEEQAADGDGDEEDTGDEAAEELSTVAPADLAPEEVTPEAAPEVEADEVEVEEEATADDVAEAEEKSAEASDELKDAQDDFDKAQEAAVDATKDAEEAAEHAEEAAAELTAAETEYTAVTADATAVVEDATGVSGALPGGASAEDLAAAETVQADAGADMAEVTQTADEAIDEYNKAAATAAEAQEELDAAAAAVTEADAAHEEASATAAATEDAYQEVMADVRMTPVEGGTVSTHYGASGSVWSTGHHTGVDYTAPEGTEVVAAASGTVVEVGYDEAYGNRIVIEHEDGYYTTYNHLSDTDVEVGQEVTAGDHIGEVGNTGNSFGSHLHFEVTQGGDGWSSGSFMDPEAWLADG